MVLRGMSSLLFLIRLGVLGEDPGDKDCSSLHTTDTWSQHRLSLAVLTGSPATVSLLSFCFLRQSCSGCSSTSKRGKFLTVKKVLILYNLLRTRSGLGPSNDSLHTVTQRAGDESVLQRRWVGCTRPSWRPAGRVPPTPTLPQEPDRVNQAVLSHPWGLRQDWLVNSA